MPAWPSPWWISISIHATQSQTSGDGGAGGQRGSGGRSTTGAAGKKRPASLPTPSRRRHQGWDIREDEEEEEDGDEHDIERTGAGSSSSDDDDEATTAAAAGIQGRRGASASTGNAAASAKRAGGTAGAGATGAGSGSPRAAAEAFWGRGRGMDALCMRVHGLSSYMVTVCVNLSIHGIMAFTTTNTASERANGEERGFHRQVKPCGGARKANRNKPTQIDRTSPRFYHPRTFTHTHTHTL